MSGIRVYTAGQQLDLLRRDGGMRQASYRLGGVLHHHMLAVEELAVERAMTQGVETYGDAAFHMPLEQLKLETMEELADGVMYQRVYDLRSKGLI